MHLQSIRAEQVATCMICVGGAFSCHLGTWTMKYVETWNVLQTVWMAYPDQAGSPQGPHGVSCDPLVANVLGIGSGWKQSRQN